MSRLIYTALVCVLAPYAFYRLKKRSAWRELPWREFLGFVPRPSAGAVWIHTVSVGEAMAARGLVEYFNKRGDPLLLTCVTATARQWLREQYPQATIAALPLDLPGVMRRFFRRARPKMGIIVEAEYWPNLLLTARTMNIPMYLANARLSAKSARRYRRYANGLMRDCIGVFTAIAAQTRADARRLKMIGAAEVIVAGNLKFSPPPASLEPCEGLSDKPTILLAATRPGEEAILLEAMPDEFLRRFFLIWAPRHPQRGAEIKRLLAQRGVAVALRSRGDTVTGATQAYIADTLGEMPRWYGVCDAAIIGGSFVDYGGQNPIEAMSVGIAAVVGPYTGNYRRMVRRARACGALAQAQTATEAVRQVTTLLSDTPEQAAARQDMARAGKDFCASQGGALAAHIALIERGATETRD